MQGYWQEKAVPITSRRTGNSMSCVVQFAVALRNHLDLLNTSGLQQHSSYNRCYE